MELMGSGKGKARRVKSVAKGSADGLESRPDQYRPDEHQDAANRAAWARAGTGAAQNYYPGLPEGVYAEPLLVIGDTASETFTAAWRFADDVPGTFATTGAPLIGPEPAPGHDVFTADGAWIGADRPHPHLRFTNAAIAELSAEEAREIITLYRAGRYGDGEAGFASYNLASGESVWLVDDAVRSAEGEPPMRDPATSPGPLTVLLRSDY